MRNSLFGVVVMRNSMLGVVVMRNSLFGVVVMRNSVFGVVVMSSSLFGVIVMRNSLFGVVVSGPLQDNFSRSYPFFLWLLEHQSVCPPQCHHLLDIMPTLYKRVPLIKIANLFIPSKQNNKQASNQYRLTRRVSLMEQELLTFPEHLSSPPVFSGVRVTQSID